MSSKIEPYNFLKPLIKTLINLNNSEFWLLFRNNYHYTFFELDPNFDKIVKYLHNYYNKYDGLPKKENIKNLLTTKGEIDSIEYLNKIFENSAIEIISDKDLFIVYLEETKLKTIVNRTSAFVDTIQNSYTQIKQTEKGYTDFYENLYLEYSAVKSKLVPENKATEYLLYSNEGIDLMRQQYEAILEKKERNEKINYSLPFEYFSDVALKPGDLFIAGGYTSNGKSVLLKYLTYDYVVNHCKNSVYFTLEMEAELISTQFNIMHANNKSIFPNTPRISYRKWQQGLLTKEEATFLHNVVAPDLCNNESYGVLKVFKPNKVKFTLEDIHNVIKETQNEMEVQVLTLDYLTLLAPITYNGRSPTMDDYNQMIKDFKQLLLTNLYLKGQRSPIIGVTAAQISRQGYTECLKSNEKYSMSAFSMYNELERSADVLATVLRTPAHAVEKKIKLQVLKNRDGSFPYEPKEVMCDVEFGGLLLDAKEQANLDLEEVLKAISI